MKTDIINIIVSIFIIILFLIIGYYIYNGLDNKSILQNMLKKEIITLNESDCKEGYCKCWDYSNYYNKTLHEKYPQLDIRWIREVDICNNQSICKQYHTYILVNGWNEECILDQNQYVCIKLQSNKNNLTRS